MSTRLAYKDIPLAVIEPELVFVLLRIKEVQEYDPNSKPTGNIVGYSYEVVNSDSFEKCKIKILGKKPLMAPEELQERREKGEKIYVEFENATIKAYWNKNSHSYEDTYAADGILLVTAEN
ncbi:hypothetical protein [Coprobacter fastidiosus]|uniref:hypothetical protein n=1 Tax=Coprobacter fastidiosus TaxID=1099853 RepID=UPI003207DEBE